MSKKKKISSTPKPADDLGGHAHASSKSVRKPEVVPQQALLVAWLVASSGIVLAGVLWSYWPTLIQVVNQWLLQPDYSHGFLVMPIALGFLWFRRSSFPSDDLRPGWGGAALLLLTVMLRSAAGMFYLLPLDGWTLPLTVAGVVWLLYGRACLIWSLPAIVFLWFMFPIPYSAERWLSVPLQGVATQLSAIVLLMMGQPAITEGNVILLGEHQLFVEEACSGMRIFIGVFALAYAFALLFSWDWWQKLLVLGAALPVAVAANVLRIVVTGLLYQGVSGEAAKVFGHDFAGFAMIPIAGMMLWLVVGYLTRLFPEVEEVDHHFRMHSSLS